MPRTYLQRPAVFVLVTRDARELAQLAGRRDAVARVLVLDGGHDLELGAAPRAQRAEDAELLVGARAARLGACEEHERAPLLLERAQRRAAAPHHKADAVLRHLGRRV